MRYRNTTFANNSLFSDILHWIEAYSWDGEGCEHHIDRLYCALDQIQLVFLKLYDTCLSEHPHPKIHYERGLVFFHRGEIVQAAEDLENCAGWAVGGELEEESLADFFSHRGELYFHERAYDRAVAYMTEAITRNPSRKDYHLSRAAAYLELGNFDLAWADFISSGFQSSWAPQGLKSGQLVQAVPSFTKGVASGLKDWSKALWPALLATGRGISKAIWAVYPFPGDDRYKAEIIANVSAIVDYVREHRDHGGLALVPEFRELLTMPPDQVTNEEIGYRSGYLIGKYGADVLSCVGIAKLAQYSHSLKQVNTMATLEAYGTSSATGRALIERTAQHSVDRAAALRKASAVIQPDKQGKHLLGHQHFKQKSSIWEWGDPQEFVNQYRGTGVPAGSRAPGLAGFKETVDAGGEVGLYFDGNANRYIPTTRATIHYAQDGCHVVPSKPKEWLNGGH